MDSKDFDKLAQQTIIVQLKGYLPNCPLHYFDRCYGSQGKDACSEYQSDPRLLNKLTRVRILARAKVLGSAFTTDLV